ncbi:MAG: hypothetical protein ABSF70_14010 [Terracidiphilus sp.]
MAVLPAHSTACTTPDTRSRISDGHYLAQYLLVVIEPYEIAVFSDSL